MERMKSKYRYVMFTFFISFFVTSDISSIAGTDPGKNNLMKKPKYLIMKKILEEL